MDWRPIATAPKELVKILVYYDHDADRYWLEKPGQLTDYAAEAESGDFLEGAGVCVAVWGESYMDGNPMEGEPEYRVPGNWFQWANGDCATVCNPTHWMPLPAPPS